MRNIFVLLLVLGFGSWSFAQDSRALRHSLDNMPLVPSTIEHGSAEPTPKRDENVRFYLKSSVRVVNGNIRGSATICYYDSNTKTAYLVSCGHLFKGQSKAPGGQKMTCFIDVFYKNNQKLDKPQQFQAEVICYDNEQDISFMKFKPDWEIDDYFPIAPLDYPIKVGDIYESTGCDHATEVAAYTVEISRGLTSGRDLVSVRNSPRPGRSGGALLSPDGYYLAIVWGTSDYSGTGEGYYVPLRRLYPYALKYQETSFLLNVGKTDLIQQIPIVDVSGQSRTFPKNFVPRG